MKNIRNPRGNVRNVAHLSWLAVSLAVALAPGQLARAVTYDWVGGDGKLSTPGNYSPNGTPGVSDVVRFNSASYTAQPSVYISGSLGELLFDSGNTGTIYFGGGTSVLTLFGVNGTGLQINAGSGAVTTANGKLALGDNQSWINNSANLLTVSGSTTNLNSYALTIDGTGSTVISGTVTGTGSITKAGAGTLTLSNANTYSGGTTISAGTVKIGNGKSLGDAAGAVSVASGAVLDLMGITMTNANNLTLNGTGISASGALTNNSATAATYIGLLTLGSDSSIIARNGNITLSNTGTITGPGYGLTIGGAKNTTISSIIGTGSGSLTKQDTGLLTLSAANTYTGKTTITGGTLALSGAINSASSLVLGGNGTLSYTATAGATQSFNGTTVNAGNTAISNATSGNTVALGTISHTLGGVLNISSLLGTTTTTNAVDSTGILGTWVTTGSGTALTYAKGGSTDGGTTAGTITAYAGTSAATAAGVTSTDGSVNYDVSAVGTLGAGASVNTLRYTGVAGTIAGNLTTNGLMNAGSGALTYSGALTIGANKELVIASNTNNIILTGAIADNAGGASSLTYAGTGASILALAGAHNFTGQITVSSGKLDLRDQISAYTNAINLASASSLLDAANTTSGTTTINGNITGAGQINKNNSGTIMILNGTNTHSGGTTLVDGGLFIGNNNALGSGTLTIGAGKFASTDNTARTIDNALAFTTGTVTLGATQGVAVGQGDLAFSWAGSTSFGAAKTWNVNNATTVTFNNSWTGNPWTQTKGGTGTLVFNAAVTSSNAINFVVNGGTLALNSGSSIYMGTNTVNNGATLSVTKLADAGVASSIGKGSATPSAADLVLNGGTLKYTGAGDSTNRQYTLGLNGGTFDASGSGALSLNGAATLTTGGARTLTLTGNSTANNTFGSSIGDDTTNTTSLTKNGIGKWILSGANNYTGATTVNAGTLLVSGAINGSATTVNSGGTLGGTGSIKGLTLNAGGFLTPGDGGIGILSTQNSDFTWNGESVGSSNAQLKFDLSSTAGLGTSATSDLLALGTGALKIGSGSTFEFDFSNSGALGNTYTLATFGSTTFTDASVFTYTGLTNGLSGSFSLDGGSLEFTVVPEPGTGVMLLTGLGALFAMNRARRKSA